MSEMNVPNLCNIIKKIISAKFVRKCINNKNENNKYLQSTNTDLVKMSWE